MVNIIHLGLQLILFQLVTDIQVATIVMWLLNIVKMQNFNSHVYTHFRSIIRGVQQQFQNQQTLYF